MNRRHNQMRTLICLAVICLSSCLGQSAARTSLFDSGVLESSSVIVPFRLVDNRIFVDIRLNGRGPFRVIFDTGGDNIITPEVARTLGLAVKSVGQSGGTGENLVERGETRVDEMKIGDRLLMKNQDFAVISFADAPNVFGSERVDGIIGLEVLQKFVVRIDYAHRRLTFRDPAQFSYKGSGAVLSFERPHLVPVVSGEVDGIAGKFGIDTGARTSLILYGPFVEQNKLREKYQPKVEGVTGWGIGGPIRSQVTRVRLLRLGNVEARNLVTRLSLQRSGALTSSEMAGLVGPDVLKQFDLTLDYSRQQLIFEKNENYGQPDSYDRAGMWLGQEGMEFTVLDVIAGGPAAVAGVEVGDKILAIDGRSTSELVLPEVRLRLKTDPPQKKVELLVRRGSTQREVWITLRDLV